MQFRSQDPNYFTLEDLFQQPDVEKLDGPWVVWLDEGEVVAGMTRFFLEVDEQRAIGNPTPLHFACAEEGKSLGSVGEAWFWNYDRLLRSVFEDCIDGVWGRDWVPWSVGSDRTLLEGPPILLRDALGADIALQSWSGSEFIVWVPALQPELLEQEVSGHDDTTLPGPARRWEEIQAFLSTLSTEIPLVAVALPDRLGEMHDTSAEVAGLLRTQLGIPVLEDQQDVFIKTFSQYLPDTDLLLLFDADGRVVDVFLPGPVYGWEPQLSEVMEWMGLGR